LFLNGPAGQSGLKKERQLINTLVLFLEVFRF
jgi:hypothetical protein